MAPIPNGVLMGAAWTGTEFSVVASPNQIGFFESSRSLWRHGSSFPGPTTFVGSSAATWTGRGWLFRSTNIARSVLFWFYEVATDTWTELPSLSPVEALPDVVWVRYPTIVVLPDGRVAAMGEAHVSAPTAFSDRDDVWVLNLPAELAGAGEGWVLAHRGTSAPRDSELRNDYPSATAFGCGVLATHGIGRFRFFNPTLSHFVDWPMPSYEWASTANRTLSAHIFPAPGELTVVVSLGAIGWAMVENRHESSPLQLIFLRR